MYSLEELKKAETKITIIDKYDDDIRHVVDFDDIDDGFCIKEFIENEFGISFSESKKYQTDDINKISLSEKAITKAIVNKINFIGKNDIYLKTPLLSSTKIHF